MAHFIAEQVKKLTHFNALSKHSQNLQGHGINVELVEKDCGQKIRNYGSLDPDQKG